MFNFQILNQVKEIEYIFVNDSDAKSSTVKSEYRHMHPLGKCIVVEPEIWNREQHHVLISELVRMRRHWPDAKILGLSEVNPASTHAPVRVNPRMNQLRRELSDA